VSVTSQREQILGQHRITPDNYCGINRLSERITRSSEFETSWLFIQDRIKEMSFNFAPPTTKGGGRGRGRGNPPRSGKYRGVGPMKSAQGLYPIIPDNDTAFAFVEFLHYRRTAIMQAAGGSGAPLIYVSLLEGARNHIAKT